MRDVPERRRDHLDHDAKNVLSYIRGSNNDAPALYQWWRANG